MAGDQRIIHAGYRAEKMVLQMIIYKKGDLWESYAEALVNPVNTVGFMGKGLALEFKKRYPANMKAYKLACSHNQVTTGKMFVTETGLLSGLGPRWIINFPTKQHYNTRTRVEWIESGLEDLRLFLLNNNVPSVAIPALGVGNGKLAWSIVSELIEKILYDVKGTEIFVYIPLERAKSYSAIKRNL